MFEHVSDNPSMTVAQVTPGGGEATSADAALAELRTAIAEADRIEAARPSTRASDARRARAAVRAAWGRYVAATEAEAAAAASGPA